MKNTLCMLLLTVVSLTSSWGADKITTTDPEKLPAAARKFLSESFSDTRISVIKIEEPNRTTTSYDVVLENGLIVEFDRRGAWTEINTKIGAVPDAVVPAPLSEYVKTKYPGLEIRKIERNAKNTEIKLSDGTELTFDSRGELIEREKDT